MESKLFRPSRSYDIALTIKSESYTNDVSHIRISSSLATDYQIVVITINITPQTIMLKELYGQDKIDLTITKLDHAERVVQTMSFDLLKLKSEFDITVSGLIVGDNERNRTSFELITVTRQPFQTMTTMVNPVFGMTPGTSSKWIGGKTVQKMIETIIKELNPVPEIVYDSYDTNESEVLQCCIPPTTLSRAIKYLDYNFGMYNGASAVFCHYDNTIEIMNLSERIKKDFTIHIEHLTTEHTKEDITKSVEDSHHFYTFDNLVSSYNGNSTFGVLGKTLNHIVLPSDKLYHTIKQDLSTVCENYGIISKASGSAPYINSSVATRVKYYIENNGLETSEVFANTKLSKQIADISKLSFNLAHDLQLENLLKIGSVVKLNTKTQNHQDISGKYILFSSDLNWTKLADWHTTSKVELIRTNKKI